ncbi:hypothetical protein EVAR_20503_1 [Eumeta japonica]|uniref:Uncharacterized protein n=1 Tax=Eumeta variegata TaxID=151549 RepID=A0A4C1VJV6_EUMVA|nr:hypothetical protein EVAR_20503_1 [Eumeta japonica]
MRSMPKTQNNKMFPLEMGGAPGPLSHNQFSCYHYYANEARLPFDLAFMFPKDLASHQRRPSPPLMNTVSSEESPVHYQSLKILDGGKIGPKEREREDCRNKAGYPVIYIDERVDESPTYQLNPSP